MAFPTYREYSTVGETRLQYKNIAGAGDDALFLKFIQATSGMLDRATNRYFTPWMETRKFDARRNVSERQRLLWLDRDLLSITSITNGDASSITASQYVFEPRNNTPYWGIHILLSSGITWRFNVDSENALWVNGIWGYHRDYAGAWVATGNTVNGALSATATVLPYNGTNTMRAGWLLQIDTEWLYVSSGSATPLTMVRGVNGSTAATHLDLAPISYWQVEPAINDLITRAAIMEYLLRENPTASAITIDQFHFELPKDVSAYIKEQAMLLGVVKTS